MLFQNFAPVMFAGAGSIPVLETSAFANSAGAAVTTLAVNKPSGVAIGDLLLGFGGARSTTTTFSPAPTGFAEAADGQGLEPVTRTADGSEAATFTFTQNTSERTTAAMLRISNWTTVTTGTPSGSNSAGGITMPKSGLLICCAVVDVGGGAPSLAVTGMTLVGSLTQGTTTTLGVFAEIVAAGATGARTLVPGSGTARGVLMGITK